METYEELEKIHFKLRGNDYDVVLSPTQQSYVMFVNGRHLGCFMCMEPTKKGIKKEWKHGQYVVRLSYIKDGEFANGRMTIFDDFDKASQHIRFHAGSLVKVAIGGVYQSYNFFKTPSWHELLFLHDL